MMLVAKGKTLPDGTYLWTCNKCDSSGLVGIRPCDWCYGLDTERIVQAMMMGAQGQRYYALLKAFLSVQGKAMVNYANSLRGPSGKMSPAAVGAVSLEFGLNFKATCEWLEETGVIHSGSHKRIQRSNWKVSQIYDAAREMYPGITRGKQ